MIETIITLLPYLLLALTFIFMIKALDERRKRSDFNTYGTGTPGTRSCVVTSHRQGSDEVEGQSKPT